MNYFNYLTMIFLCLAPQRFHFLKSGRVGRAASRGDAGKAADWYRRAGAAGDAEAEQRLKRLIARYAG